MLKLESKCAVVDIIVYLKCSDRMFWSFVKLIYYRGFVVWILEFEMKVNLRTTAYSMKNSMSTSVRRVTIKIVIWNDFKLVTNS